MKKILFVSHVFYPSNRANAKRPFFLAQEFVEKGWQVDVLASSRGVGSDAEEAALHEERFHVERVFDVGMFVEDWLSRKDGFFWKSVAVLLRGVLWPDHSIVWMLCVAWMLRKKSYDRVLVFIHPISLLLLHKLIPRVTRHWVYDYLDSVSPQRKRHPRKSPILQLLVPVVRRIERSALTKASLAIFTSESNRNAYIEDGLVVPNKTVYISQFFDEKLYDPSVRWDGRILNIVYAGHFDQTGCRSPAVFLRSLACFFEKFPEAKGTVQFDFYGRWWSEHDSFIMDMSLKNDVYIHEVLSYKAYLNILQQGAVLLLVTAPEHNLFVPGKLLDCLGAQRPILAFTPLVSETAANLRAADKAEWLCPEDGVSEGALAMEALWRKFSDGAFDVAENLQISEWSSSVLTKKFENCVRRLI